MISEGWHERLEAYLDGEVPPDEARAFEDECAADEELTRLLEQRQRLRSAARAALGEVPHDMARLVPHP